jgi:predicted RNA binding protein YcfA (HicA-like mRNA interferase family)
MLLEFEPLNSSKEKHMIKEIKEIIKDLKSDGWVEISRNGHIKMRHPIMGMQMIPNSPRCPH